MGLHNEIHLHLIKEFIIKDNLLGLGKYFIKEQIVRNTFYLNFFLFFLIKIFLLLISYLFIII